MGLDNDAGYDTRSGDNPGAGIDWGGFDTNVDEGGGWSFDGGMGGGDSLNSGIGSFVGFGGLNSPIGSVDYGGYSPTSNTLGGGFMGYGGSEFGPGGISALGASEQYGPPMPASDGMSGQGFTQPNEDNGMLSLSPDTDINMPQEPHVSVTNDFPNLDYIGGTTYKGRLTDFEDPDVVSELGLGQTGRFGLSGAEQAPPGSFGFNVMEGAVAPNRDFGTPTAAEVSANPALAVPEGFKSYNPFSEYGDEEFGSAAAKAIKLDDVMEPVTTSIGFKSPLEQEWEETHYTPEAVQAANSRATMLDRAAQGIKNIESYGGRYGAVGNKTATGDRAYGAYQVMGANIPSWTKEHYGKALTPSGFLKNEKAQDAVFRGEFGNYLDKYGPKEAAGAWFAGEAGRNRNAVTDVNKKSVGDYKQDFADYVSGNKAYGAFDTPAARAGIGSLPETAPMPPSRPAEPAAIDPYGFSQSPVGAMSQNPGFQGNIVASHNPDAMAFDRESLGIPGEYGGKAMGPAMASADYSDITEGMYRDPTISEDPAGWARSLEAGIKRDNERDRLGFMDSPSLIAGYDQGVTPMGMPSGAGGLNPGTLSPERGPAMAGAPGYRSEGIPSGISGTGLADDRLEQSPYSAPAEVQVASRATGTPSYTPPEVAQAVVAPAAAPTPALELPSGLQPKAPSSWVGKGAEMATNLALGLIPGVGPLLSIGNTVSGALGGPTAGSAIRDLIENGYPMHSTVGARNGEGDWEASTPLYIPPPPQKQASKDESNLGYFDHSRFV